jgi:thioredoxin 1
VSSIPNLAFFKDGELIDRVVGFSGKEQLEEKIQTL